MPDLPDRLKDYITVAERIEAFIAKYPEGSLQARIIELTEDRVVMEASAYRDREDKRPGVGYSSMPIPARNIMLRDSEIETCETSAWGRAIAALGFEVRKGVASRNEIDAKSGGAVPQMAGYADGIIGTVQLGKPPVDLELRQTPDGPAWGFKLKDGSKSYQALAIGSLADALAVAAETEPEFVGTRVEVWGKIDLIPWDKGGKNMPPFARINLSRVKHPEWTLPASSDPSEAGTTAKAARADEAVLMPEDAPQTPASSPSRASVEEAGASVDTAEAPLPEEAGVAGGTDEPPAVTLCHAVGSDFGTVCGLPKGHANKHKELATADGRVLASW